MVKPIKVFGSSLRNLDVHIHVWSVPIFCLIFSFGTYYLISGKASDDKYCIGILGSYYKYSITCLLCVNYTKETNPYVFICLRRVKRFPKKCQICNH